MPRTARAQNEFNRYLTAAARLYETLEYERALEQVHRAKKLVVSIDQDVAVALYEGIILADMGKREESLVAFRTALLLDPNAKLPINVSPKMMRDVEEVRARVRKELAPGRSPRSGSAAQSVPQPSPPAAVARIEPPQPSSAKPEPPKPPAEKPEQQGSTRSEPKVSAPPAPPSQPASEQLPFVDRTVLRKRLEDAEARLRQKGNQAVMGPALTQLKELREQAAYAATTEQRMNVAARLDKWERRFLIAPEDSNRLKKSDVLTVVTAQKPAIIGCVNQQRERERDVTGTLVMRWFIQTNGSTSNISCVSGPLCSTFLAGCLSGLIQGWTFPEHSAKAEVVEFPFSF